MRRVKISSDCDEVIKCLHNENIMAAYGFVLKEILVKKEPLNLAIFGHERGELIREAHALAKHATSLPECRHTYVYILFSNI